MPAVLSERLRLRRTMLAVALLLCPLACAHAAQGERPGALMRRELLAVDSRGQPFDGAAQGTITDLEEVRQAEPNRKKADRELLVEVEREARDNAERSRQKGAFLFDEAEELADFGAKAKALGGRMRKAFGVESAGAEEKPALEAQAQVQPDVGPLDLWPNPSKSWSGVAQSSQDNEEENKERKTLTLESSDGRTANHKKEVTRGAFLPRKWWNKRFGCNDIEKIKGMAKQQEELLDDLQNAKTQAEEAKTQAEDAKAQAEKDFEEADLAKDQAEKETIDARNAARDANVKMTEAVDKQAKAQQQELEAVREGQAAKRETEKAKQDTQKAREDTEKANKEMKRAIRLTDKAVVEKNCMEKMFKEVSMDISVSDWHINVPEGAMIHFTWQPCQIGEATALCLQDDASAHRCPNSIACPKNPVQLDEDRSTDKDPKNCVLHESVGSQCQRGYDSATPGCASCAKRFGRSASDPFICEGCGNTILQWLLCLIVPIMLYVASVRSAFGAARRGVSAAFSNDALKILLAFSSASALVASNIDASPAFRRMPDNVRKGLSVGVHAAAGDTSAFASGLDCLVNGGEQQVGPLIIVGLAFAQPAIAMPSAMAVQVTQRLRSTYTSGSLLVCYIVATNQFVPLITAACARSLPCLHTQKDDSAGSRLTYQSLASCDHGARYSAITGPLAAGAIVVGPLLWIRLIRTSSHAQAMKFITGSYTQEHQYWEAFRLTKTTLLAVTGTLSPTTYSPGSKLAMALFTLTVFLGAHLRFRPYKYQELNDAEALSLIFTCCSLICAIFLANDSWSSTEPMQVTLVFLSAGFLMAAFVHLMRFFMLAKYREFFEEEKETEDAEEEKAEAADAGEAAAKDAEEGKADERTWHPPMAWDERAWHPPMAWLSEGELEGDEDQRHPEDDKGEGGEPQEDKRHSEDDEDEGDEPWELASKGKAPWGGPKRRA